MILQTERLGLRRLEQSDFKALSRILQDGEVMYAYNGPFNDEETQAWLDRQLAQRGCRDLSKVFLLLVDEADAIYFVQKDESA